MTPSPQSVAMFFRILIVGVMWMEHWQSGNAIKFVLPARPPGYRDNQRCLIMNMEANTLVTGHINSTVLEGATFRTSAWIEDSLGNRHWQKNNIVGDVKYSFRTHGKPLDYVCCVSNTLSDGFDSQDQASDIEIVMRSGVDLFDDDTAHDLRIKPLEGIISGLEVVMRHVVQEWDNLYMTERQLRDVNESTNDRVRYLCIITTVVLVLLWTWQILVLKQFLRTKKLI